MSKKKNIDPVSKTPGFKKIVDLRHLDAREDAPRNIKYEIIVPKTDNSKNVIRVDVLRQYAMTMAKHFGGMTMSPELYGCWKPEDKDELVCDAVASIFSVRLQSNDAQTKKDEKFVEGMAMKIGEELGQSSVMIMTDSLEGLTKFVEGVYKAQLPADIAEKWDEFARAVRG